MKKLLSIVALVPLAFTGCDPGAAIAGLFGAWWADVMMADFTPVSRVGDAWVSSGTAVTANMIQPAESVTDRFDRVTDRCLIFSEVASWHSREGADAVTLSSSRQTATADYDGTRYAISGLAQAPAFADVDGLEVVDDSTGETTSVEAPPPITDPDRHLGPPNGLATIFRAPAEEYDIIVVFVAAQDSAGGQNGIMCGYRPDEATAAGELDEVQLVDDETIAEFEARGLVPTTVSVAYHNEDESDSLFDDPIAVHAGRMLQVQYPDLVR